MAELTKEQKDIIRMIEKEAKKAGVDPDFAVALASLESGFRHIPATDKKSTAFGPLQVNKATAEANGVDYEEMKKSPELAVRTGIMNLARHANNPKFEGDPLRIAAAHRYGENSEYAKTGDPKFIDKTLATYLADAMDHFPEQSFPERVYTKPSEKAAGQEMDMGTVPLGANEPTAGEGEQLDMGSQPLEKYSVSDENASDRRLAAAEGAGAGAFIGAVKVPAIGIYKKAYDYLHRAPQAQDIESIIDAANKINEAKAAGQAGAQAGTQVKAAPGEQALGPNAKYVKKFGDPVGLTQAEIASSTGMGKGEGQAWDIIKKAREANQKISGTFGEGWVLDPERQIMVDTSAGAGPRNAPRAPTPMAPSVEQRQAEAIKKYTDWVSAQNQAAPKASRLPESMQWAKRVPEAAKVVAGSSPVRGALAGMGIGYNLENAHQQFGENTPLGNVAGATSVGGALASGLSAVPKYASKANPAAIGLTAASQVMGDVGRGDYDSAKANAYLGALGLAPLPVAIGALMPSGLNKGEEEELARYRRMQPPHLRP